MVEVSRMYIYIHSSWYRTGHGCE